MTLNHQILGGTFFGTKLRGKSTVDVFFFFLTKKRMHDHETRNTVDHRAIHRANTVAISPPNLGNR